MEKEFIPYEQALALKELGFDEPCLSVYTIVEKLRVPTKFSIVNNILNGEYNDDFIPNIKCLAPTYSQAFRFFRDKYNLDSFVKHLYKSTIKVGYYFGIDEYKGVEFQMDFDAWYNTYEEAELACLKKLIEIVESNLNK
jgi:hypothetical protein